MLQPDNCRSHTANPKSNTQLCNRAISGQFGDMARPTWGRKGWAWERVLKGAIMPRCRESLRRGEPPKFLFSFVFLWSKGRSNSKISRVRARRLRVWMTRRTGGNPGSFHQPSQVDWAPYSQFSKAGDGGKKDWIVSSLYKIVFHVFYASMPAFKKKEEKKRISPSDNMSCGEISSHGRFFLRDKYEVCIFDMTERRTSLSPIHFMRQLSF